jgi:membrane-bound lytic murein transglycosylase A
LALRVGILRTALAVAAASLAATAAAWGQAKPLPKRAEPAMKAGISYQPVPFAQLPGWEQDDHAAAFKAFLKSCERVAASAQKAAAAADKGPTPPPPALASVCMAAARAGAQIKSKENARAFFEQHFTANAVVHKGPEGLFTGYYEPLLMGSRKAEGPFKTPIYKRPPDLVNLVDETQRAKATALTHARKTEKGTEPYFTREQIERGALKDKNLELMYFADTVEVFFMQIQGSGRVKLTDGSTIRVHYDGKNGHPYSSIGRYLIEKGLLAADKVSMGALARWLRADPERGKQVMWQNQSFVFFRELGGDAKSPLGALNIALTPGRSLAVDTAFHALGSPIYIAVPGLSGGAKAGAFNRLMVAQDVGSAIRGPERGDIYFGSGAAAGQLAGTTKHAGKFFVLLAKPAPAQAAQNAAPQKKAP